MVEEEERETRQVQDEPRVRTGPGRDEGEDRPRDKERWRKEGKQRGESRPYTSTKRRFGQPAGTGHANPDRTAPWPKLERAAVWPVPSIILLQPLPVLHLTLLALHPYTLNLGSSYLTPENHRGWKICWELHFLVQTPCFSYQSLKLLSNLKYIFACFKSM